MRHITCLFKVQFSKKVFPTKIEIYESYKAGAVKRVQFLQPNSKWYTAWEIDTVQKLEQLRIFSPRFQVSHTVYPSMHTSDENWKYKKNKVLVKLQEI